MFGLTTVTQYNDESGIETGIRFPAGYKFPSPQVWSNTSFPPYSFIAWFLIRHRDNFT
jgi:hypothetical protein